MPTVNDMARGYIQQCQNKMNELKNQSETISKDIETLSAHIQECIDEVESGNKITTCESKGIPSESSGGKNACEVTKEDVS